MEGYISEIRLFAGNFAPRGWMFCAGGTLSINDYTPLFALIGTTFGGNGQTNFKLPDLQGRVPVGNGQRPGGQNIVVGQVGGTETVTMSINQMPAHTHGSTTSTISIPTYSGAGTTASPSGNVLAALSGAYSAEAPDGTLKPVATPIAVTAAGGTQPFQILQPTLVTNYIICVEGIFPSRN
ncbi:phage tail protein [Flavobacterium procerum]|uniref:Phage tail protein n=1 Tax=Flavobacterium procerum TaxID=1455569 RepID=A0ABV6BRC1_9FLAO